MAATYTVGDLVKVQGTLENDSGVAVDPSTVSLKIRTPAGTTTTYTYPATVSKSATGVYYKEVSVASSGKWSYRFESTGTGQAAEESFFVVSDSQFD